MELRQPSLFMIPTVHGKFIAAPGNQEPTSAPGLKLRSDRKCDLQTNNLDTCLFYIFILCEDNTTLHFQMQQMLCNSTYQSVYLFTLAENTCRCYQCLSPQAVGALRRLYGCLPGAPLNRKWTCELQKKRFFISPTFISRYWCMFNT